LYLVTNRPEEAEAQLSIAIEEHPGVSTAHSALGFYYYHTGQYAAAAMEFESSAKLNPSDMNTFSNLGASRMMLGEFDEALGAFERALAIEPRSATYTNIGLVYYFLGDYERSIEHHSLAVELEPNDYLAISNLADALWVAGRTTEATDRYEQARNLVDQALSVNPKDPFSLMDRAWLQANLDESSAALDTIHEVLELLPDDPYAHYYHALCEIRAGNSDEALEALGNALQAGYEKPLLSADPMFAGLRESKQFLELIESES
jgi:superkiller protein 3